VSELDRVDFTYIRISLFRCFEFSFIFESSIVKRTATPEEEANASLEPRVSDDRIASEKIYWMTMPDFACRFGEALFDLSSDFYTHCLILRSEARLVGEDVRWSCHIFLVITDFYAESSS
jgi:hypothetical protein